MKLRLVALAPILFLIGCSTFVKRPVETTSAQTSNTYPMDFGPTPPETFGNETIKKSASKSVKEKNKSTQEMYIGKFGFLNRPPIFTDKNYEKSFQRCSPVEVTGVYQSGDKIFVYVKQNGYTYPLAGLNRKDFTRTKKKKIPLLDQYLVKTLDWVANSRQVASENQKVCSGQTWKNMPKNQFQFISGDPETRRPLKNPQGQYDVWTYGAGDQSTERHYYFQSGKLYSWTQ